MTAFAVAALAVGWLARTRLVKLAIDQPNARSLHTTPVPRTGGIGLLLGTAAGWILTAPAFPLLLWCAVVLVIAISLLDDLRGLSAAVRLAAHLLAATLAAVGLLGNESLILTAGAVFAIAWMCNLYNFMDGSDGLAGGMTFFGFTAYAAAAWLAGSMHFALINIAISAAAVGFLIHNFHPARIFLGDAGSVTIGFFAATFGLIGWVQHDWTWWFPFMVFSPFVIDASITLLRRLIAGARVWEAHRDHYYQRLVQLGFGHRNTALMEYAMMGGCAIAGLWAMTLPETGQYSVLAVTLVIFLMVILRIEQAWKSRSRSDPHA